MLSRILNRLFWTTALGVLAMGLAACGNTAGNAFNDSQYIPASVKTVNHTMASLNWVSVNGMSGSAGEICCVMLPNQWRPGLKANVEWEIDPNPYEKMKRKPGGGFVFDDAAIARHKAAYTQHKAIVDIPQYPDGQTCGLKIYFLVCNQLKATTSCLHYTDPNYPIKDAGKIPEPETCPKTAE
ncbi:DUF3304 domain-containing protein [Amantichitinum ursilacus]|uniref:DUF3304 domain-containing protein n=1 Tax=Amantichitinum ursilacus TaxID=857265 RepID=A0A0N0XJK6_9NEIS|nr:DUF3304 domain-containing protein [Amantichitinum ursilacus]KPC53774.1 hypothetical protein WG78_08020 [Amantichitinum ursilacus]